MKNACAYIRVSTDMQLEYSLDSQLKLIKNYAKKNNLFLNELFIYKDEGISGRNAQKRPAFNKMICDAKLGLFQTVLIYNTSRFARNHEESIIYRSLLKRVNIEVVSITQPNIDPKTDLLMNALYAAIDERFSIELSENVKRGMIEKVKRGKYISCAPFGYIKKEKNTPIEILEDEAKIVCYLFNEYLNTNKTIYSLAKELNDLKITTKRGNLFDRRGVYNILTNTTYKGFVKWTCDSKTIYKKADHIPIIEESLFEAVSIKINKSKNSHTKKNSTKCNHWLVGILVCTSCGSTLIFNKGYKNRQDKFRCGGYNRGICKNSNSIYVENISYLLIKHFETTLSTLYFCKKNYTNPSDLTKDLKIAIKKLKNILTKSKASYLNGVDTLDEYKLIKKETNFAISKLEAKIIATKSTSISVPQKVNIIGFLNSSSKAEEKNHFARILIKEIRVDFNNSTLNIIFNTPNIM
jgi:site-specific DNA recombinase